MGMEIKNDIGITERDIDLSHIYEAEKPAFEKVPVDIDALEKIALAYKDFRNLILVGYGGSNTSFLSYFKALYSGEKKVFIVNTVDPDYLFDIKSKCKTDDSLVVLISKSGTTAGVLETYFFFQDYNCVIISEEKDSPLVEIAKRKGYKHVVHPAVGGRFSGRTSCAYFPALLLDIPVREIEKGFSDAYNAFGIGKKIEENELLQLSVDFFLLEQKGYTEIFCPLYSTYLEGFSTLIMQLVHESSCKHEIGQTIYTALAPESQHHTNQRFFGGRKNVCGLFMTVKDFQHPECAVSIPESLKDIPYNCLSMSFLDDISFTKALSYEFIGTYQNALDKKIPAAHIELSEINPYEVGYLMGMLQYFAVYSSLIRGVNPYDQPHVEDSKNITIDLLKGNR
jgi:glucose-6-phosphate isomerase